MTALRFEACLCGRCQKSVAYSASLMRRLNSFPSIRTVPKPPTLSLLLALRLLRAVGNGNCRALDQTPAAFAAP